MWHVWVFFLDVSIIVYPIALIQSWWKTRSRTGSALAGGWWLSLQEAYLGRLGGAHLETKRWLGWISRRQLVLVCISFFLQLIASIPKASAEVPYKSCSFRTHQGPLQPRQHRNCTELLKVERGWESWNLLHLRPKQHGYDKASFAILLSVLKWFESMTHMCHWNALESRKPQGIMTTALEYMICVSVRVEALSPSLALQPLEASKKILPCVCVGPVLDKGWLEDQYDQYGPVWIKLKQPDRLPRGTHPAAASFAIQRVGDYPFQDLWRSKLPTQTIFLWPLHSSLVVHWVEKFEGSESGKPD